MSFLAKALQIITDDPEQFLAAMSGSATDALINPKGLMTCVMKTAVIGFFLAEFVSPAIVERLKLSPKEAVALSFVCGYAGIRGIRLGENLLLAKLQPRGSIGGAKEMSTPSSKPSEVVGDESAGSPENVTSSADSAD